MQSQKDKAILLVKDKTLDRFWSKVGITANPNRCWEWQGKLSERWYGEFCVTYAPQKDTCVKASRVMYYLHNNIHPEGKIVCHTCDNPKCVNPKHLFLGTNKDNTQDMIKKNRNFVTKGTDKECTWAKLDENDVKSIREIYETGIYGYRALGEQYGVDWSTIRDIIKRVIWKHII